MMEKEKPAWILSPGRQKTSFKLSNNSPLSPCIVSGNNYGYKTRKVWCKLASLWSHWSCASIYQLKAWHTMWCPWSCANVYQQKAWWAVILYISIFMLCFFINSCYTLRKQKAASCLSRSVVHVLLSHYNHVIRVCEKQTPYVIKASGPLPK